MRAQYGLEVEIAVDAPKAADGVIKDAVIGRGKVLLNVAWIVVIGHVDDFEATEELNAVAFVFEIERILNLQVQAGEGGKTPGLIALPDVVPVLIELRIGEPGMRVEDGNELKLVW